MKESKHFSRTGAIVDLKAIHANMEAMKSAAQKVNPDIKILATVKADAYGHGACEVANCVKDLADMYSVACTDEGIELRNEGSVTKPILILGPTFAEDDEDTIRFGLTQTVFTFERAKQLDENAARYREENGDDPEALRKKAAADQDAAGQIVALLKENEQKKKRAEILHEIETIITEEDSSWQN